jgi:hypothetical protein
MPIALHCQAPPLPVLCEVGLLVFPDFLLPDYAVEKKHHKQADDAREQE